MYHIFVLQTEGNHMDSGLTQMGVPSVPTVELHASGGTPGTFFVLPVLIPGRRPGRGV